MGSDDLGDRIAKARSSHEHDGSGAEHSDDAGIPSAMSFGLTAGAQFVAAVVLGGGLGWAIDRWLGTSPVGLLILMVVFFVAAMVNVWRSMSKAVESATEAALAKKRPGDSADGVTDEIDEDRKSS